jgi:hypothetical protein
MGYKIRKYLREKDLTIEYDKGAYYHCAHFRGFMNGQAVYEIVLTKIQNNSTIVNWPGNEKFPQTLFKMFFKKVGTISKAAELIGVNPQTINKYLIDRDDDRIEDEHLQKMVDALSAMAKSSN